MRIETAISGVDHVIAKLDALGKKVSMAAVRRGLRKGAYYLLPHVQQNVPAATGNLRDSLRVRSGRRRGEPGMLVTTAFGWFQGETFYGGFIEWGHDIRRKYRGPVLGHVPGEHFALHALEEHGAASAEIASLETLSEIDLAMEGKAMTATMMEPTG